MQKALLTQQQKSDFLNAHLRHRLTLLRTLRDRKAAGWSWDGMGDLYRCAKDSALISIRLLTGALGLRGEFDASKSDFVLKSAPSPNADDVQVDQLGGQLVPLNSLSPPEQRLLAGVCVRANKELAHLTLTYNEEFNREDVFLSAATLI